MGYYVKGFGADPLVLTVAKTNHPEIVEGTTPREAILTTIQYCQQTLNDWVADSSLPGQKIVKEMKSALKQLKVLLTNYP